MLKIGLERRLEMGLEKDGGEGAERNSDRSMYPCRLHSL